MPVGTARRARLLVRWLARSQSDPRKAVAELVQNSLDAQARTVRVRRYRAHGGIVLSILDDGEGVLPDLATHVGHSRKRPQGHSLSQQLPLRLML